MRKQGRIHHYLLPIVLVMSGLLYSCETGLEGQENINQPPETHLTVDQIQRTGENRLSSQIKISWWGDDPDGYVVGFEYAIDDTSEWGFTHRNDSTFILPIPEGNEFADVNFYVRAVDNDDLRDPDPAELQYPVKNTPPKVSINATEQAPDTTYEVFGFGWTSSDLDGEGNLDHVEIAVNDTVDGWIELPIDVNFVTMRVTGTQVGSAPSQQAYDSELFIGKGFESSDITVPGVQLNSENLFYVRAFDKAGAPSKVDTVRWYVKKQMSRILLLNDYSGGNSANVARFHKERLQEAGYNQVDYWDISDGEASGERTVKLSSAFPATIEPTLIKTIAAWDHIYWVSNSIKRNINYAQEITSDFLDNGGSMFVTIPMRSLEKGNPIFNFLPVDSTNSLPQGATDYVISSRSTMDPTNDGFVGDTLGLESSVSSVFPIYASSGSIELYTADYQVRTLLGFEQYEGNEVVAVKNPEGNLIFFGQDLTNLNENDNLGNLLMTLLNDELGFTQ